MKKITATTEQKLMGVIEKTAALVHGGMTPNAAIIDAATSGGLRPGEVSLVVHAYNTGQTTRRRDEGDDPFTKSADFALADTAIVLEAMYPTTVKTAAAKVQDTIVSPEYSYSPTPMLERKTQWDKRANNIDWRTINGETITAPVPLPTDPKHRAKVAMAKVDRLKIKVAESRRCAAAAFDQLGDTVKELTTYFQRPGDKPLPVVKEAVILLHGGKGEQIMDELVRVTPSLAKLANHVVGKSVLGVAGRENLAAIDSLDCTTEPFPLISRILTEITDYQEKKAAWHLTVEISDKEASETLAPFALPVVSPSILGTLFDDGQEKTAVAPLQALGAWSLMGKTMDGVASGLKGPEEQALVDKTVASLDDPQHEAQLRGINAQAMMQDLMINDPVIAGYSPDEVTSAYNDIVQVSPSVADQRMIMQSLLRKQLQQGQLDTFEQDQLLGFEDKLRKQQQPMPAGGRGDGSVI